MNTWKRTTFAVLAGAALLLTGLSVQAQDAPADDGDAPAFEPDQAVETLSSTTVSRYTRRLYGEWRDFLSAIGLQAGANEGDLFIASGTATVPFPIEHPGFIEGRGIAYEIAYIRAKAEMIRFLGTAGTREQVVERLETAAWERGQSIDDVEPLRQGARIARKLADLTEKQLDAQIEKIDPDYDAGNYDSRAQKEEVFRRSFQQRILTTAAAFVAGATPLKVYEGFSASGDNYQVLVGLVWSPKLSRLAGAVGDNARPMPAAEAGPRVDEWLPGTLEDLIPSWGVHKLINERGEQVLVAFGQAAPRATAADRRDRANEAALEVAALRAEGSDPRRHRRGHAEGTRHGGRVGRGAPAERPRRGDRGGVVVAQRRRSGRPHPQGRGNPPGPAPGRPRPGRRRDASGQGHDSPASERRPRLHPVALAEEWPGRTGALRTAGHR